MSDTVGWGLIYQLTEEDLKKKEDVLTLLIHFLMIKAGYECIGLGDDVSNFLFIFNNLIFCVYV